MEQTKGLLYHQYQSHTAQAFEEMNLNQALLQGIYSYGIKTPTTLQQRVIKSIILGRNLIAQTQSGTCKTLAFSVGMLQIIDTSINNCQALVLTPTSESAQQIHQVIIQIGQYLKIISHLCIGNQTIQEDMEAIESGVHVLIATPEKMLKAIFQNHLLTTNLKTCILDNADQLILQGFKDQIYEIINHLPEKNQFCMFSGYLTPEILKLANDFIRDPIEIMNKDNELTLEGIAQYYIWMKEEWKPETWAELIDNLVFSQAIIYVNTTEKAELVFKQLKMGRLAASYMHGEMDRTQRELIMEQLKTRSINVLISTLIQERWIDIQVIDLVINYDMPENYEDYLKRIGRRGCYGKRGLAISFVNKQEIQFLKELEQHFNINIQELPEDLSNLL